MDQCRACGSDWVQVSRTAHYATFFALRVPVHRIDPDYIRVARYLTETGAAVMVADSTTMSVCAQCHFMAPRKCFSTEDLQGLYDGYRGPAYNRDRIALEPTYGAVAAAMDDDRYASARRDALWEWLRPALEDVTIDRACDFGGADGRFIPLELLERCGEFLIEEVSGVPPIDPRIKQTADIPDGSLDMALCMHVLEHVGHPLQYVRRMVTKVAAGGFVYVEVPAETTIDRLRGVRAGSEIVTIHEHINGFMTRSLDRMMQAAGLEVIGIADGVVRMNEVDHPVLRCLARR